MGVLQGDPPGLRSKEELWGSRGRRFQSVPTLGPSPKSPEPAAPSSQFPGCACPWAQPQELAARRAIIADSKVRPPWGPAR